MGDPIEQGTCRRPSAGPWARFSRVGPEDGVLAPEVAGRPICQGCLQPPRIQEIASESGGSPWHVGCSTQPIMVARLRSLLLSIVLASCSTASGEGPNPGQGGAYVMPTPQLLDIAPGALHVGDRVDVIGQDFVD